MGGKGGGCRRKKSDEFTNVSDLSQQVRRQLLDMEQTRLLFVDPGKDNVVQITDGVRIGSRRTRCIGYTGVQRRRECGFKRSATERRSMLEKQPDAAGFATYREVQDQLKLNNRRSCTLSVYEAYLRARVQAAPSLSHLYSRIGYRRARYRRFLQTTASVDQFWDRVAKRFHLDVEGGLGRKVVFCWGNWGRNPNLKYSAPSSGIGFRRTCPWPSLTVDERMTSCTCHGCGANGMQNFMTRIRQKPHGGLKTEVVHGLLRCPNEQCCSRWWQRDVNGALNIRQNALHIMEHGVRHPQFVRHADVD